jgi:hypothetical protein
MGAIDPGSGVRFFEIGRNRAGSVNETLSGQFRKTEHLTPDALTRLLTRFTLQRISLVHVEGVVQQSDDNRGKQAVDLI